jgi:hypothetical protein
MALTLIRKFSLRALSQHLTRVLAFSAWVLLVPAGYEAGAFPVFCNDMTWISNRVLTGCQPQENDLFPSEEHAVPATGDKGKSSDGIDAILTPRPLNRQIFQVGRHGLPKASSEAAEETAGHTETGESKGAAGGSGGTTVSSAVGGLTYDERWYYMALDKDGTYLFIGDAVDGPDPANVADENQLLPDGIGIGKKWRF